MCTFRRGETIVSDLAKDSGTGTASEKSWRHNTPEKTSFDRSSIQFVCLAL